MCEEPFKNTDRVLGKSHLEQEEALREMYESGIILESLKNIHGGNRYLGIDKKKNT